MNNKTLHMIAWILLVIGGLNWGLAAFDWEVVERLLGESIAQIVFILVGLSALYELFTHKKHCSLCKGGM